MKSRTTLSRVPDPLSTTLHNTTKDLNPVSTNIFQALPHELVERIFLLFGAKDILTCRLVNREFNEMIQSSTLLQYFLACNAAGVIDNPRSSLSYAERREALNNREDAWRTLNPVFETTIKVEHEASSVYDLTAGTLLLGDNNIHYCHLPSSPQDNPQWFNLPGHDPSLNWSGHIVDIGMAVYEHDLVANVIISKAREARAYRQRYSLDLVLLKFSTGEYHPLARHPRIHVQELPSTRYKTALNVVGDNLALLVRSRNGTSTDKLYIFDWKTGHKRLKHEATEKSYSGLVFVSPEILLVPNIKLSHFEIWRIPSSDSKLCKPPSQILSLKIPEVSDRYHIFSLMTHANPSSFLHSIPHFPSRPFLPSPDESIIVATIRLVCWEGLWACALIMHRSALLDTIQKWTTPSLLEQQKHLPMWLVNRVTITPDWVDESFVLVAKLSKLVSVMPQAYWSCPTSISSSPSSSSISSTKAVVGSSSSSSTSLYDFPQLQWADWGPSISRWFELDATQPHWNMNSAGQRCAFSVLNPRDRSKFVISVADFNPHNVRRNARLMAQLRANNCGNSNDEEGWVEEEELEMFDHEGVFSEDVYMGLKCIAYPMPGEHDCNVVLMDEERLLGLKFDEEERLESVNVLYFG